MQKLKFLKFFVLSFSLLVFSLAPAAQAIDVPGWPLVPCGLSKNDPGTSIDESKPCGQCDIFQLFKNILDFVMGGLMPPVAVLLFVWAGFLILLGGANVSWVAKGQEIFKNTFWGIVIMLSAWMITNTLILSVGANYNNANNWWQFTCVERTPVVPPSGGTTTGGAASCPNPSQIAQQNNVPFPAKRAPELDTLISCVTSRIGNLIDQSQIYTYELSNNGICNYTRGQRTCGSCKHAVYSCHYGGRDGKQGSLAVDFNAKTGSETALYNELVKLKSVCKFGNIQLEPSHTHVSAQSCSGN